MDLGGPHLAPTLEPISFFEYAVHIGHFVQLRQQMAQPTRMCHQLHKGITHEFLQWLSSALWDLQMSRCISYFMWLIVHAGLPIGTRAAIVGHDWACVRCTSHAPESICHCLWTCSTSCLVWRAVSWLLSRVGIQQGCVTWSALSWLQPLSRPHLFMEGQDVIQFSWF